MTYNMAIEGCTKEKIMEETQLSHDQLRRITAEMVDKELLHYIEYRLAYITTDKGYIFLNRRQHQSNILHTNSKVVDNKINTREEESINSIASKQNIIHTKIQLWTNRYQNEFAIRVTPDSEILLTSDDESNIFLASTNPKEDYITVVAETDYFEDLKHGWKYTLSRLVEQYKQEILNISLRKNNTRTSNNKANNKNEEEGNNNNNTIPIRLISIQNLILKKKRKNMN